MGRRRFSHEPHAPKYRQVLESLARDILSGRYQAGQKFPSEAALVQQFRTSRITVGRALRELAQRGLVERIAGSGTYVRQTRAPGEGHVFGLLIPDLGRTEIFEPICRGIAASPQAGGHALLWGSANPELSAEAQALQLCGQFVERRVAGVFFAPLENGTRVAETNREIVTRLEAAHIPIVLLDRCILPYPDRCAHDLVGIDNRRAGFMAARHLLDSGIRQLAMMAYAGGAPTVAARIAGFREAAAEGAIHRLEAIDETTIRPLLPAGRWGVVCANDRTAGQFMQVLLAIGRRIPEDVAIVGIDDVEYASLLPVPLTTVHQPCREIGEAALGAMLARVERPGLYVRDLLLQCRLVIRRSA
jgi:DNA-binding LacI/PurR family transcriptional regulator